MVKFSLAQTMAVAFLGSDASRITKQHHTKNKNIQHGAAIQAPPLPKIISSSIKSSMLEESHAETSAAKEENEGCGEATIFQDMCQELGVLPRGLLRLDTNSENDIRGVYVSRPVLEGDLILRVPLDVCLLDDDPPEWWTLAKEEQQQDIVRESFSYQQPSEWAPRLAASLLGLQLKQEQGLLMLTQKSNDRIAKGQELWLRSLPDPEFLRASLPVHWPDAILSSARCTALELAVDSAYFARAEAVADLMYGLKNYCSLAKSMSQEELERRCHNALDLVQTRSCRAEDLEEEDTIIMEARDPLRLLAPVFDMINHGSSNTSRGEGKANAKFGIEVLEDDQKSRPYLSVRATHDLSENTEVLIDYGASARPPWKCLLSYGFVPQQTIEDIYDDGDDEQIVAEVFMDGTRFEVSPSTIPVDLVAAAASSMLVSEEQSLDENGQSSIETVEEDETELELTPEIALRLANRISDASAYLLLDDDNEVGGASSIVNELEEEIEDAAGLISLQLASSLRFSQHRILRVCAEGLKEFAKEES